MVLKKTRIAALVCLILMLVAMFAPSPREWGSLGKWLSPHYDYVKPVLQPIAHVVTMALMAFIALRIMASRPVWIAISGGLFISMVAATAIEFMQLALPSSFSRTFDLADLVYALLGTLAGCLIGIGINYYDCHRST
jgi:VanZ family protein